ncbi:hypothetical protein RN001_000998 [Aquatica leii]|uniref:Uncharacterized protein n=1 Tax=Aquatica leii TaxID=1421715 RepID=A0AAN7PFM3_9COLE|nr:hypothetical protein RN001_000998 [Aquatica leii]
MNFKKSRGKRLMGDYRLKLQKRIYCASNSNLRITQFRDLLDYFILQPTDLNSVDINYHPTRVLLFNSNERPKQQDEKW